jgi:ABC-type lipoprotein export system ATPase subunit
VLLADEPTAQLDRVSGRLIIRLLDEAVRETGTTVVAASHDPDVISAAQTRLTLGSHEERLQRPPHAAHKTAENGAYDEQRSE